MAYFGIPTRDEYLATHPVGQALSPEDEHPRDAVERAYTDQYGKYEQFLNTQQQIEQMGPEAAKYIGGAAGLLVPAQYPGVYGGLQPIYQDVPLEGFSPEQKAAYEQFQSKYPGYAQLSPNQVKVGPGGRIGPRLQQAGNGQWISSADQVKFDPEYGLIAPLSAMGASGNKGQSILKGLAPVLAIASYGVGSGLLGAGGAATGAGGAVDMGVGLSEVAQGFGVGGGTGVGGAAGGILNLADFDLPFDGWDLLDDGITTVADSASSVFGDATGQQATDAIAQTLYNEAAQAGLSGFDASLVPEAPSGGGLVDKVINWGASRLVSTPFNYTGGVDDFGLDTLPDVFDSTPIRTYKGLPGEPDWFDKVWDWAERHPYLAGQLAGSGIGVGGGLIRGAMTPSLLRAKSEEELKAALKLIEARRGFGQLRNINVPVKPSNVMLRTSSVPGLINSAMKG